MEGSQHLAWGLDLTGVFSLKRAAFDVLMCAKRPGRNVEKAEDSFSAGIYGLEVSGSNLSSPPFTPLYQPL
jgi:hypothetical protein